MEIVPSLIHSNFSSSKLPQIELCFLQMNPFFALQSLWNQGYLFLKFSLRLRSRGLTTFLETTFQGFHWYPFCWGTTPQSRNREGR